MPKPHRSMSARHSDLSQLKYGCSVTDGCIGWDTTEKMIRDAGAMLRDVLPARLK